MGKEITVDVIIVFISIRGIWIMEQEKQYMMSKKEIGPEEMTVAVLGILITIGTILILIGGIYYDVILH
ncbi:MAG TPA: hypothetical protein VHT73_10680 [Thermodesulfobacteriota bacterium]|nr:hypothetical protein [Thermodesulfobacteriota bacterium]